MLQICFSLGFLNNSETLELLNVEALKVLLDIEHILKSKLARPVCTNSMKLKIKMGQRQ